MPASTLLTEMWNRMASKPSPDLSDAVLFAPDGRPCIDTAWRKSTDPVAMMFFVLGDDSPRRKYVLLDINGQQFAANKADFNRASVHILDCLVETVLGVGVAVVEHNKEDGSTSIGGLRFSKESYLRMVRCHIGMPGPVETRLPDSVVWYPYGSNRRVLLYRNDPRGADRVRAHHQPPRLPRWWLQNRP